MKLGNGPFREGMKRRKRIGGKRERGGRGIKGKQNFRVGKTILSRFRKMFVFLELSFLKRLKFCVFHLFPSLFFLSTFVYHFLLGNFVFLSDFLLHLFVIFLAFYLIDFSSVLSFYIYMDIFFLFFV